MDNQIKQQCLTLIQAADIMTLSTIDENGYPQTRAMANLRNNTQFPSLTDLFAEHENDFLIYAASDNHSHKFQQLSSNPKVSVYFCTVDPPAGLMLCGDIEIPDDQDLKNKLWQKDWTMYFPDGPESPQYNILSLKPNFARCWFAGMTNPAEITF